MRFAWLVVVYVLWMCFWHFSIAGLAAFTSWDASVMFAISEWPDAGRFFYGLSMVVIGIVGLKAMSDTWDDWDRP